MVAILVGGGKLDDPVDVKADVRPVFGHRQLLVGRALTVHDAVRVGTAVPIFQKRLCLVKQDAENQADA